jgi:hypothetical protein
MRGRQKKPRSGFAAGAGFLFFSLFAWLGVGELPAPAAPDEERPEEEHK